MVDAFRLALGPDWFLPDVCVNWAMCGAVGVLPVKQLIKKHVPDIMLAFKRLQRSLYQRVLNLEFTLIDCVLYVPYKDSSPEKQCVFLVKNHDGSIIWRYIYVSSYYSDSLLDLRDDTVFVAVPGTPATKMEFNDFMNSSVKILLHFEAVDEQNMDLRVTKSVSNEPVGTFQNISEILGSNVYQALNIEASLRMWISVECTWTPFGKESLPVTFHLKETGERIEAHEQIDEENVDLAERACGRA